MSQQVSEQALLQYPRASGASPEDVERHMREHIVNPVVSLSMHARSLSSLAECLRGSLFDQDPETGQRLVDVKNIEMYLKSVNQLCTLFRSDNGKLLFGRFP